MREIKFRAWDSENEQMIGVLKLDFLFESEHGIRAEGYCDCEGLSVDHEKHAHPIFPEYLKLMQFTGLKDRNGRDIYEGDILKHGFSPGRSELIVCSDENMIELIMKLRNYRDMRDLNDSFEIIGNIHENPELI